MKKGERTKQHIIIQAAPIFNEKGISGTTVDDVLAAASVARGCLYNLFDDKDDLAQQTVSYLLEETMEKIRAHLRAAPTAKGKIYAYLDLNKTPVSFHTTGGCPIVNMGVEADDNHPAVQQLVRQAVQQSLQGFSRLFRTGIEQGEWTPALKADEFAFKMFAAIEGAIVLCRVLGSNKPMQTLIKELKAELVSFEP